MSTALEFITKQAGIYAQARSALSEKVTAIKEAKAQLQRENYPEVKRLLTRASDAEARLFALIEANPDCFVKPKTLTISGVKLGYQKGKGSVNFEDADAVVARIKKHLPDQVDVLIQSKEVPVKSALAQLTAVELKKLGVSVTDAEDQIVIKTADSEIDKTVEALLKAASVVEGQ